MAYNNLSSPQSLDLATMISTLDDENLKIILRKVAEFCTLLRADITAQESGDTRLNTSIQSNSVVDTSVPILKGLDIRTSSGGDIEWSAGQIFYRGSTYNIAEGTLDNTYAYWDAGDTTLSGSDVITAAMLDPERFWLAERIDSVVYPTPISPILITGLLQAGTVYTNVTYTGDLIVGGRTGLTTGTGMYSNGTSGDWSVGVGTTSYISLDTSANSGEGQIVLGGHVSIPDSSTGNVTYYQSTRPSGASEGDLWYDTDDWTVMRYNGTTWDIISDITSHGTSANTSNVGSISASVVSGWAHSEDVTTINGGKIHTGSIEATAIASDFSWAQNFIMSTNGKIYTSGKSYGAGSNGIFLGDDDGKYKFDITNGNYYFRYDGVNPPDIKTPIGILGDNDNYFSITDKKLVLSYSVTGAPVYGDYVLRTYISPAKMTIYANGEGVSVDWWGKIDLSPNGIYFSRHTDPSTSMTYSYRGIQSSVAFIGLDEDTGYFCIRGYDYGNEYRNFYLDNVNIRKTCTVAVSSISYEVTTGGIAYGSSTSLAMTAAGSSGQALVSNGTSAPSWQGRAVTAYGVVYYDETLHTKGDGFTVTRNSTGKYRLNINSGSGKWIVIANVSGVSDGRIIHPMYNSTDICFKNDTDGNISIVNYTGSYYDLPWSFQAIRIS